MIVTKHGFNKRYAYGGSGIFDTTANLLTIIFTSSAAKQIASSALDVGKRVAKEGAKKGLDVWKSTAVDVGKKLVTKALTPKSKKILQKYMEPTTQPTMQDINPFPNKPWFLRVCSTSLLKTLWVKKKLLVMTNFFFSHSVFHQFVEISAIFIRFEIVVCKLFQFGPVQNLSFGEGLIL